ncbi:MAG: tRNA (adenosine(37)-N6)-threonylcarbamoyltransferase complex transferase subunit TsaD, partial [Phycisphaerae bacterium]|nr:tRNA (adenosine(37)-N6)-threonylcarbamoyltransferase complex transferase subunit TsaD [Phycisphaerae bacterium]
MSSSCVSPVSTGADCRRSATRYDRAVERALTVLGIETSCDETAAAVVELRGDRLRVRSNIVGSQVEVHAPYGGVVPELASRAHLERMLAVIRRAAEHAGVPIDASGIDAVAVGVRPGLIGSLLVGTSAGKALAWSLGVPFLGVDHVAAHLVAALLDEQPVPMPALGMVVSGGHTAVFRMDDACSIRLLARTPDDAVGEAFDKGATILGLPYPGGPEVERCARNGRDDAVPFPVPRVDFSFSGLKTALLHEVRGVPA